MTAGQCEDLILTRPKRHSWRPIPTKSLVSETHSLAKNGLGTVCGFDLIAMATFLPDNVERRYRVCAWVSVLCLYLVPTAYVMWKGYSIYNSDLPSLQTSMSADWGAWPYFLLCSAEGLMRPLVCDCSFGSLLQVHAGTKLPQNETRQCTPNRTWCSLDGREDVERLTSIFNVDLGSLRCMAINATMLRPKWSNDRMGAPPEIRFKLFAEKQEPITLWAMSSRPPPDLRVLTGFVPGTTVAVLKQRREGRIRVSTNPALKNMSRNFWGEIKERHFYESLASVLYPKLIDTYSTQLEFQYPGLKDRDGISRYDVDLKVASPHVVEEVEIGRCPQIAFLLAQLGGYTFLGSMLAVFPLLYFPEKCHVPATMHSTMLMLMQVTSVSYFDCHLGAPLAAERSGTDLRGPNVPPGRSEWGATNLVRCRSVV